MIVLLFICCLESRLSSGSVKPSVVMKLSGVGECQSIGWLEIDSHNIETNIRLLDNILLNSTVDSA